MDEYSRNPLALRPLDSFGPLSQRGYKSLYKERLIPGPYGSSVTHGRTPFRFIGCWDPCQPRPWRSLRARVVPVSLPSFSFGRT